MQVKLPCRHMMYILLCGRAARSIHLVDHGSSLHCRQHCMYRPALSMEYYLLPLDLAATPQQRFRCSMCRASAQGNVHAVILCFSCLSLRLLYELRILHCLFPCYHVSTAIGCGGAATASCVPFVFARNVPFSAGDSAASGSST